MDNEWLKSKMDKLRSEASRGPVPGSVVFALTDPIMDKITREQNPKHHPCCGCPADGLHNPSCRFADS